MFILKNSQAIVDMVAVEGVPMPFYTVSNEALTLVRERNSSKSRAVPPDQILTVSEAPLFKAQIEDEAFEYPDYAVWCRRCHVFIGWASMLNLMAHCTQCRNGTPFYNAVEEDLELYVAVQAHHYSWTHGPSDDAYHDGMYNAHEQAMDRLQARWTREGVLAVLERLADHYDLTAKEVAKYFLKLANTPAYSPEPALAAVGPM
jgi:hypothetical protein